MTAAGGLCKKEVISMSILAAFIVPHPPIILPEIGHGEEKKIGRTTEAYRQVMKTAADLHPDTLIITSPHADAYLDYHPISPGPWPVPSQKPAEKKKSRPACREPAMTSSIMVR